MRLGTFYNHPFVLFEYEFNYFRLELNMELPQGVQAGSIASTQASQEQDELSQRLARLRQAE